MSYRSLALHASDDMIARLDAHAVRLRRSRNWLIIEAIDLFLKDQDAAVLEQLEQTKPTRKKAGAR